MAHRRGQSTPPAQAASLSACYLPFGCPGCQAACSPLPLCQGSYLCSACRLATLQPLSAQPLPMLCSPAGPGQTAVAARRETLRSAAHCQPLPLVALFWQAVRGTRRRLAEKALPPSIPACPNAHQSAEFRLRQCKDVQPCAHGGQVMIGGCFRPPNPQEARSEHQKRKASLRLRFQSPVRF